MRATLLPAVLTLLAISALPAAATTYYVSAAGNDTANGTSTTTAWQTIKRVNTLLSAYTMVNNVEVPVLKPGDSILFRGGDVFRDDYLKCNFNPVNATSSTTLANTPQFCSGNSSYQVTFGTYGTGAPILDGANPFAPTWTLVSGSTYSAPVPQVIIPPSTTAVAFRPMKLFVDAPTSPSAQLLPVPNARGAYASGTTYNYLDLVSDSTDTWVHGYTATSGVSGGAGPSAAWVNLYNNITNNTTQIFSTTNSGLANVEATAGSWYTDGTKVYVHLSDGSNPASHTFEVTVRPYGILLQSANYVTVQGISFEHQQKAAIDAVAFTSSTAGGSYFSNEYNQFLSNNIWNVGDITVDSLALQNGSPSAFEGGIIVRADGSNGPHLLRGIYIAGNTVKYADNYFGTPGLTFTTGIAAIGIDGGGTANNLVVAQNYVSTVNAKGIIYDAKVLTPAAGQTSVQNNGGRVYGNELTNNQGNIFFTATVGGRDDHNFVHESYGEGVQSGGYSVSTSSVPQTEDHNVIVHLGKSATGSLFNGFDCNGNTPAAGATVQTGGAPGIYFDHNTVYDTNSASITLEYNCENSTMTNNIFDEYASPAFPGTTAANSSFSFYFREYSHSGVTANNNLWSTDSSQPSPFHDGDSTAKGSSYSCTSTPTTFLAFWPDSSVLCSQNLDPKFTNPAVGTDDFSLQSTSPAIGKGTSGSNIGAYDGTGDAFNGVTTKLQ